MRVTRFRTKFAAVVISTVMLVGCGTDKPDDKEGIAHISKNETVAGEYTATHIKRNNGWPEADGQYKVEYTYDLVAESNYVDAVQSYINAYESDPDSYFAKGMDAMNASLVTAAAVTNSEEGELGFVGITRQNLQKDGNGQLFLAVGKRIQEHNYPEEFKKYINTDTATPRKDRIRNVLYAMAEIELKGFKPETKKGQVIMSKQWQLLYKKTEKGWQLA